MPSNETLRQGYWILDNISVDVLTRDKTSKDHHHLHCSRIRRNTSRGGLYCADLRQGIYSWRPFYHCDKSRGC